MATMIGKLNDFIPHFGDKFHERLQHFPSMLFFQAKAFFLTNFLSDRATIP